MRSGHRANIFSAKFLPYSNEKVRNIKAKSSFKIKSSSNCYGMYTNRLITITNLNLVKCIFFFHIYLKQYKTSLIEVYHCNFIHMHAKITFKMEVLIQNNWATAYLLFQWSIKCYIYDGFVPVVLIKIIYFAINMIFDFTCFAFFSSDY